MPKLATLYLLHLLKKLATILDTQSIVLMLVQRNEQTVRKLGIELFRGKEGGICFPIPHKNWPY